MTDKRQQFVDLYRRRNRLKAELKQANEEIALLQHEMQEDMVELGVQNIKMASGATIYIRREVKPRIVDSARVYEVCIAAGLPNVAKKTYNWRALQGELITLDKNGEPLPDSFNGVIEVEEVFEARVLAAGQEGE